jgi:hypothetical protein
MLPLSKLPICEECGDIIDSDDDSIEVKIVSEGPLTPQRGARVHLYLCLLVYRLKNRVVDSREIPRG